MAKVGGARAASYIDGTRGDVGVALFDLIRCGRVATFKTEIDHLAPDGKTVVFADGQQTEFNSIVLCTGSSYRRQNQRARITAPGTQPGHLLRAGRPGSI